MLRLLRENWLWIAVPFVLVAGGLLLLFLAADGGAGGDFTYDVFG